MHSKHAQTRNQQRGIPPVVHEWLTRFGAEQYDGHGGIKVFFSKGSKKQMEKELGKSFVHKNERYLNIFRVESSDNSNIITCGHRTRRINKS
jgi:hypothetical protein